MHRWGASVFIILMFFHMARVFLFGAYKYPRELNWIIGVLILATGMFEGFTGYLLPWDQTAYWASVVGININGTGPFVGPFLASFLRGGAEIAPDTLPRFYALHMLAIPGALFALIGLHLYLVVRLGVSPNPWSKDAAGDERPHVPSRRGLTRPAPRGVQEVDVLPRPTARGLQALQAGRRAAREALLPVRDVPRHGDEPRRRLRDHRARRASGSTRACSACSTPPRPTRERRASSRVPTGTSTSSSICSGSSSGRRR